MENTTRLEEAMARLSPQSRRVMELWLQGASHGEIGQTLGLSERTIKVIRDSSLWKLRELIARNAHPGNAAFTIKTAK